MTPEQFEQAIAKALTPIVEKVDALEKANAEPVVKEDVVEPVTAEEIGDMIAKAVTPLNDRIEAVAKSAKGSKAIDTEVEEAEEITKKEEVVKGHEFDSLFTLKR